MIKRTFVLVAAVLALAVGVAACGGGGDEETTSSAMATDEKVDATATAKGTSSPSPRKPRISPPSSKR